MRAVVQRVDRAAVEVAGKKIGDIGPGLLVFLGVGTDDTDRDLAYIVDKVTGLRIFEDASGKMNLSVTDVEGSVLAVSQFTLYGDCRKGKRPSFDRAGKPEFAREYYDKFLTAIRDRGLNLATGEFQAHMLVSLVNNGPVTIMLDSHKDF